MDPVDGDGILYTNITFKNWYGDASDGETRPPIRVICPSAVPCTDITLDNINLWTDEGDYEEYLCENASGSGYCLDSSDSSSPAATTQYVNTAPVSYSAATLTADLTTAFGTAVSIPIPTIPTSFYPGATPISALAGSSS